MSTIYLQVHISINSSSVACSDAVAVCLMSFQVHRLPYINSSASKGNKISLQKQISHLAINRCCRIELIKIEQILIVSGGYTYMVQYQLRNGMRHSQQILEREVKGLK